jgi:hypothetical protein
MKVDDISRIDADRVWSSAGFHVVDIVTNGVKFCSAYYLSRVLDPLLAALQPDQQHPFRKLCVALTARLDTLYNIPPSGCAWKLLQLDKTI